MEEQAWITQAAAGDTLAFARLMEKYEQTVYRQAFGLLGNPEDAADITQEVFWKVWQALPAFRSHSSFSTWLYRLTSNACMDHWRREKKRQSDTSLSDAYSASLSAQLPHPSPSPQDHVEAQERWNALNQGLAQLSPEHRHILVLRELNGLSYQKIGAILGLSTGTVKSRLARARLALANFLQRDGNLF